MNGAMAKLRWPHFSIGRDGKMADQKLADLHDGDHVQLFALIKDAQIRQTRKGDDYLALTFSDRSGDLSGNFWDVNESQEQSLVPGVVVYVEGTRSTYKDKPQLNIDSVRLASDDEPNSPADYVARAPESEEQIKDELRPFMAAIDNFKWRQIVFYLIKQHGEDFFESPAAKSNHHAYVGGLSFHTLSILRLAKAVCSLYSGINAGLLYAGAILHDLGKTVELSGAIGTQYTVTGKLIGHISLIDGEICAACDQLHLDQDDPEVVLLRHMVLAHHGLQEYGSPVRPQLMEAEILHHLDELDASIMMMQSALDKTQPGDFTERIFALDNRSFYRPIQNKKNDWRNNKHFIINAAG